MDTAKREKLIADALLNMDVCVFDEEGAAALASYDDSGSLSVAIWYSDSTQDGVADEYQWIHPEGKQ